jgi:hypothetical protein
VRVLVRARGAPRPARLLTPEGLDCPLTPRQTGGYDIYTVPEVPIYAVLALPAG